jgi:hypothetical protein
MFRDDGQFVSYVLNVGPDLDIARGLTLAAQGISRATAVKVILIASQ